LSDLYAYIKSQADMVRNIALESVLGRFGSTRDKKDKAKWHTSRGAISVTGTKFINWKLGVGGGGAIDLVMHLKRYDYKTAVSWLTTNFSCSHAHYEPPPVSKQNTGIFKPPQKAANKIDQVRRYLAKRCIPPEYTDALIKSGKLYADNKGNAVFLLLGKENKAVGAELRGTGKKRWRGMAKGSKKKHGCFYVNRKNCTNVALCESAIDAISYSILYPNFNAISMSGVIDDHPWISSIINRGYQVFCGFDADEAGDHFAMKIIQRHPSIKRIRPILHDWNDDLKSRSNNLNP
jgi:hypothetical protein